MRRRFTWPRRVVTRARPEAAPVVPRPVAPAEEGGARNRRRPNSFRSKKPMPRLKAPRSPPGRRGRRKKIEIDETLDDDTFIEEQEEEDADVTDIIGGDIENRKRNDYQKSVSVIRHQETGIKLVA